MQKQIIAALFENLEQAEHAIGELRGAGMPESAISVVTMHRDEDRKPDGAGHVSSLAQESDSHTSGAVKGAATGGAVGIVAGLAALAIPGVGPFVAAGAIGQAFGPIGSALLMSGAVGATAGGLAAGLVNYGIDEKDAEEMERRIREGAVLVTVEADSGRECAATRAVLRAAGGETAARAEEPQASAGTDALK
jgi:hypothetical protein